MPGTAKAPGVGDWAITVPEGAVRLRWYLTLTDSPADSAPAVAAGSRWPIRLGS